MVEQFVHAMRIVPLSGLGPHYQIAYPNLSDSLTKSRIALKLDVVFQRRPQGIRFGHDIGKVRFQSLG